MRLLEIEKFFFTFKSTADMLGDGILQRISSWKGGTLHYLAPTAKYPKLTPTIKKMSASLFEHSSNLFVFNLLSVVFSGHFMIYHMISLSRS